MNKEEYPELYSEYDKSKNLVPFEDLRKSHKDKVWWVCPEYGHSYSGILRNRVYKLYRCPICAGQHTLPGFNDLLHLKPGLASEWDTEKNSKKADEVTLGSKYRAWWLCPRSGHSYDTTVKDRVQHETGCPFCTGRKPILGVNDLRSLHPEIAKEWDYGKNTKDILTITSQSHSKVWWLCSDYGHSYHKEVRGRTRHGQGCPICSGRRVLLGFNSLVDTHPHLVKEWDTSSGKSPHEVSYASTYKPVWRCLKGHLWRASVLNRVFGKSGCPWCSNRNPIVEELIRQELLGVKARVPISGWKMSTCEVDCLLEDYIAVEYDGSFWHRDKVNTDVSKTQDLIDSGYYVIRVREQSNGNVLPLLPPVRGLYQIRYTYDKDHTHLLEMLQYLLYTVRYDRLYLDHLENNDKGNR